MPLSSARQTATFAVGGSPGCSPHDVLDVGGGLGPVVFDGGLEGGVVAFVLVGVFLGEVGDRRVEGESSPSTSGAAISAGGGGCHPDQDTVEAARSAGSLSISIRNPVWTYQPGHPPSGRRPGRVCARRTPLLTTRRRGPAAETPACRPRVRDRGPHRARVARTGSGAVLRRRGVRDRALPGHRTAGIPAQVTRVTGGFSRSSQHRRFRELGWLRAGPVRRHRWRGRSGSRRSVVPGSFGALARGIPAPNLVPGPGRRIPKLSRQVKRQAKSTGSARLRAACQRRPKRNDDGCLAGT